MAQTVRNLPAVQETWVRSLGGEDASEKEMARNQAGYNLWGHKEPDTAERLTLSLSLSSADRDSLTSFFPIWMLLFLFLA